MKRPTKDAWAAARQRWEADPTETFESIAARMGVSRVAVSKQANKPGEEWKRPANLREISEQAQRVADAKVTARKAPKLSEVTAATSKKPAVSALASSPVSSEQAAIDVRADKLVEHREDWEEHRRLFTLQAIADDFNAGKQAKISAEMLLLRQKGERAAYGISEADEADKPTREFTDTETAARLAYYVDLARRRQAAQAEGQGQ